MAAHGHWLLSGGALLAALAALAWAFWLRPVEVEVAPVTRGVFESTVEEDCKTHLSERYTLSTPVTAALERTNLREGDTVRCGDVVARLQAVDAALLDQATVALADAWRELQRTGQLAQQGFVADARLGSARLAVSAARNALDVAGAQKGMAIQEHALASAALQSLGSVNGKQWVLMQPQWMASCSGWHRPTPSLFQRAQRCWSSATWRTWRCVRAAHHRCGTHPAGQRGAY